jgi:hypothetical protein
VSAVKTTSAAVFNITERVYLPVALGIRSLKRKANQQKIFPGQFLSAAAEFVKASEPIPADQNRSYIDLCGD